MEVRTAAREPGGHTRSCPAAASCAQCTSALTLATLLVRVPCGVETPAARRCSDTREGLRKAGAEPRVRLPALALGAAATTAHRPRAVPTHGSVPGRGEDGSCPVPAVTALVTPSLARAGSGERGPTFAAVLPHAQVQPGDVLAAAVAVGELRHPEHVPLHVRDVVRVVTQDPGQGRLLDLRQLGRREHPGVLVPQPASQDAHTIRARGRGGGTRAAPPSPGSAAATLRPPGRPFAVD